MSVQQLVADQFLIEVNQLLGPAAEQLSTIVAATCQLVEAAASTLGSAAG
jgi:hypothetical protein